MDSYKEKTATTLLAFYDYLLTGQPDVWRVARKKIALLSDCAVVFRPVSGVTGEFAG